MVVEVVVMVVLVSELMMSELMVMVVAVVVEVEVLFLSPQSVTRGPPSHHPPLTLIITHKNFPSSALHHLNTFHSRIFQTKSKVKNFENIF